jgi:hypothetical protein
MARKKKPKAIETFINGQTATVPEIIENVGGDKWKEYIEANEDNEAKDRYLHSKLGEYLSASELHERAGITATELAGWRRKSIVRWEQIGARYYYSVDSVLVALKTSKLNISK